MPDDRYLLGNSSAEIEHLTRQAEVYAPEAEELLDLVNVLPGGSAADIGCGALGILAQLRHRVGSHGRVVGVDRDERILEVARQLDAKLEIGAELVRTDATALDLPSDTFDLVHERTVLLNVTDPARVVSEMTRITRPGGVVALQEPDSASWVCDPPHPAWDTLLAELLAAYASSGRNFDRGRMTARLLRDAGLVNVGVRATARVTAAGEYYQTFLLTMTSLVREQILAAGRLRAADFDPMSASLREHLSLPGTLTSQPNMWQAWGTKP